MRKTFANLILDETYKNQDIIVLTADLGFKVWDKYKETFPNNFYNVGAAEQLMIGTAIGLSYTGKIPICYSITPFLLFRPYELIRNYVDYEKIPIKLVGSGRNKEYKSDGISHWAEDDLLTMMDFYNIKCFRPNSLEELKEEFNEFLYSESPCYISLSKKIYNENN